LRQDEDRPVLPIVKQNTRVKLNGSFFVTIILIAAIAFLGVAIYRSMTGEQEPTITVIEDPYGGVVSTTQAPSLRPVGEEGRLPVFYQANTSEKKIALTVQNIKSDEDLEIILGQAGTYGAKLTFFVTGTELTAYSNMWADVILGGHELESRGFTGAVLNTLSDEEMRTELDMFTLCLRSIVGEGYMPHFVRTDSLADDTDARVNAYLSSQGYYGFARWRMINPSSNAEFENGQIIYINLADYGTENTGKLMSYLEQNGWAMVTMNSLFEYEDNFASDGNEG